MRCLPVNRNEIASCCRRSKGIAVTWARHAVADTSAGESSAAARFTRSSTAIDTMPLLVWYNIVGTRMRIGDLARSSVSAFGGWLLRVFLFHGY